MKLVFIESNNDVYIVYCDIYLHTYYIYGFMIY